MDELPEFVEIPYIHACAGRDLSSPFHLPRNLIFLHIIIGDPYKYL